MIVARGWEIAQDERFTIDIFSYFEDYYKFPNESKIGLGNFILSKRILFCQWYDLVYQ